MRPGFLIVLCTLLCVAAPVGVGTVRYKFKRWNQDDEEETEALEKYVGRVQNFLSVFIIFVMCMGGPCMAAHDGDVYHICSLFRSYYVLDSVLGEQGRVLPEADEPGEKRKYPKLEF